MLKTNTFKISPLLEEDFSFASNIDKTSNYNPWTYTTLNESLKGTLKSDHVFSVGFFINDNLIAFVIYQKVLNVAEIIHLICMKDQQKKGIASRLIKHIKDNSFITEIFLEVRESNIKAINFYKKNNFKIINKRKDYYNHYLNGKRLKEDALIMKFKKN